MESEAALCEIEVSMQAEKMDQFQKNVDEQETLIKQVRAHNEQLEEALPSVKERIEYLKS